MGVARTHLPFVVVFVKNVTSDTQHHEKNFEFAVALGFVPSLRELA